MQKRRERKEREYLHVIHIILRHHSKAYLSLPTIRIDASVLGRRPHVNLGNARASVYVHTMMSRYHLKAKYSKYLAGSSMPSSSIRETGDGGQWQQ
jgi:hypothetical protein